MSMGALRARGLHVTSGKTARRKKCMNFSNNVSQRRIEKDLQELTQKRPPCDFARSHVVVPNGPSNLLQLKLIISPTQGPYSGGVFEFLVEVPPMYPYNAPKVICATKVFHPNICIDSGRVFLPLVDKDWRPVLSISNVLLALQMCMLQPHPDYPINRESCELYRADVKRFTHTVKQSLCGGQYAGHQLPDHRMLRQGSSGDRRASTSRKRELSRAPSDEENHAESSNQPAKRPRKLCWGGQTGQAGEAACQRDGASQFGSPSCRASAARQFSGSKRSRSGMDCEPSWQRDSKQMRIQMQLSA